MIHLKTKHYVIAACAALLTVCLLIGISAGSVPTVSVSDTEREIVILIDPGHGGIDGGAVGISGTIEKDINLRIALRLREALTAAGYTVIMTRDTDISIHDSSASSVREKKVSDLRNRLAMTKLYPDSLLVSIHQNNIGSAGVTGAQVFYSPNNPESAVLAQSIQDEFNSGLQPGKDREIKKAGKNLYLFYNAKNTAVLAECGFLSNRTEEALLCDPEYQDKVVYTIFSGIIKYLGNREDEIID